MSFELILPDMFEDYIQLDKLPDSFPNHNALQINGKTQGDGAGQVPDTTAGKIKSAHIPTLTGQKVSSVGGYVPGYSANNIPYLVNGKILESAFENSIIHPEKTFDNILIDQTIDTSFSLSYLPLEYTVSTDYVVSWNNYVFYYASQIRNFIYVLERINDTLTAKQTIDLRELKILWNSTSYDIEVDNVVVNDGFMFIACHTYHLTDNSKAIVLVYRIGDNGLFKFHSIIDNRILMSAGAGYLIDYTDNYLCVVQKDVRIIYLYKYDEENDIFKFYSKNVTANTMTSAELKTKNGLILIAYSNGANNYLYMFDLLYNTVFSIINTGGEAMYHISLGDKCFSFRGSTGFKLYKHNGTTYVLSQTFTSAYDYANVIYEDFIFLSNNATGTIEIRRVSDYSLLKTFENLGSYAKQISCHNNKLCILNMLGNKIQLYDMSSPGPGSLVIYKQGKWQTCAIMDIPKGIYLGNKKVALNGSKIKNIFNSNIAYQEVATLGLNGYKSTVKDDVSVVSQIGYGKSLVDIEKKYRYKAGLITNITTPDPAVGDFFGCSFAIYNNVIVVGAIKGATAQGKVYVFRYNGSNWIFEQSIICPDTPANNDRFGYAVTIYDNVLAILSSGKDLTITDQGKTYIYRFNGYTWVYELGLTNTDPMSGEVGGYSIYFEKKIKLHRNTLAIGNEMKSVGGFGNQGVVYANQYINGSWETQVLVRPQAPSNDIFTFGRFVDVYDGVIITNNIRDDRVTEICVYRYNFGTNSWALEKEITNPENISYGLKLCSIYKNTIIVSSFTSSDENRGCIYVFNYNGSDWIYTQKITVPDSLPNDYFCSDLRIHNNNIIASITNRTEIVVSQGRIYLFKLKNNQWEFEQIISSQDVAVANDNFGAIIDMYNNIIVSSIQNKTVANANQGKVYIYEIIEE